MCDSVYQAIVKPVNQCHLMGIERVIKSERMGEYRITVTQDNFKQYRAIVQCNETKTVISAILFDQFKTVRFKYTVAEHRGKQLTRQLFAYTCSVTKRKFKHSEHLTESGKAAI